MENFFVSSRENDDTTDTKIRGREYTFLSVAAKVSLMN
jgi:hypothetical protein